MVHCFKIVYIHVHTCTCTVYTCTCIYSTCTMYLYMSDMYIQYMSDQVEEAGPILTSFLAREVVGGEGAVV